MNEQFLFVANVGSGLVLACFVLEVYYSELICSGKLYISQALPALPSTILLLQNATEVVQSDREAPTWMAGKWSSNIADGYNIEHVWILFGVGPC